MVDVSASHTLIVRYRTPWLQGHKYSIVTRYTQLNKAFVSTWSSDDTYILVILDFSCHLTCLLITHSCSWLAYKYVT